jgi:hypothetical protein
MICADTSRPKKTLYVAQLRGHGGKAFESKAFAVFSFVLLAAVLCKQAKADDHYGNFISTQPALEFVFDAALAADMLTTADIKNHPPLVETNPILGQHPSDGKIAAYGAGVALLHAAITYEMVSNDVPKPLVTAWELIGIAVEAGYTARNYRLGLRVKF